MSEKRESNIIPINNSRSSKLLFQIESLENFLENKGIYIGYDEIRKLTIVSSEGEENEDFILENLPAILHSELKVDFSGCTMDCISAYLNVIASRNVFNPVLCTFDKVMTEWDGKDRLPELFSIIGIEEDDSLSKTLIRKWLMQSYAMLFNSTKKPFGADGILVLNGEQGIGKTSLFRKLAINHNFFKEGQCLNFKDKDTLIRSTSAWIVELGEIEQTTKYNIEELKAFITNPVDEIRLPYGKTQIKSARHTSFCGTTNNTVFLSDETGNRRFWTVPVNNIDLEKLKSFDVQQLWKQIQKLSENDLQGFRLTKDERRQLEIRNTQFKKKSELQELFEEAFKEIEASTHFTYSELTSTEIWRYFNGYVGKYNAAQIGRALTGMGLKSKNTNKGTKYKVPVKDYGVTVSDR